MSADFLIELGTEELPPKALKSLSNAFTEGVLDGIRELGLNFEAHQSFAAPRRLAVTISGLDTRTPDKDLVIWGRHLRLPLPLTAAPRERRKPLLAKTKSVLISCHQWLKTMANRTSCVFDAPKTELKPKRY